MAQLEERSLMTPEIRSSNPDVGKILSNNCTIEKAKIKKKRSRLAYLLKILIVKVGLTAKGAIFKYEMKQEYEDKKEPMT